MRRAQCGVRGLGIRNKIVFKFHFGRRVVVGGSVKSVCETSDKCNDSLTEVSYDHDNPNKAAVVSRRQKKRTIAKLGCGHTINIIYSCID